MTRKILFLIGAVCFLLNCHPDTQGPFIVGQGHVGPLLRDHNTRQLDSIFAADSLVRDTTRMQLGQDGKVEIYEKGGKHLLTLSPAGDTLGRIGNIRIHDARYHTDKGVGLGSTFGEIKAQYEIRKIITSLNNLVILLKGSDVYFTISREELPASLRFTTDPIEAVQIPDGAKVKYMMVGWD
ncbi:hypothetical protein OZ410_07510 [Robiginitalea sp. M366]|uniref:hypothetical protein n=1 Tax=Robiginitalea aestuariiviva TaxID=3036903 RepID=UPI00240E65A0|nr:hypothetical protein [Robiginitalea aestuariiviva]MDG1572159.1 hypothetical protein [Robiginitalea aestuariiviva]